MFWQFENGALMNLSVLEEIRLFHDDEAGLWRVRGWILNRRQSYVDLFSSKDVEHVKRVLRKIGDSLDRQESLISEVYVR